MMMLRNATTAAPGSRRSAALAVPSSSSPAATRRRGLAPARFQPEDRNNTTPQQQCYYQQSYSGVNDDPGASLRAGWERLKAKWDDWQPEKRSQTLAWGGGGLLVLYLASGLLTQVDRLPILPQALQLVGFAFTSWFSFRYLLYAEGREDLSRLSLDKLLGRADEDAASFTGDFAKGVSEGAEGVADAGDRLAKSEVGRAGRDVARAVGDAGSGDGSGRLSDGSRGGFSEREVKGNIKGAMKDLDRL